MCRGRSHGGTHRATPCAPAKRCYARKEGVGDGQRAWSREATSPGGSDPETRGSGSSTGFPATGCSSDRSPGCWTVVSRFIVARGEPRGGQGDTDPYGGALLGTGWMPDSGPSSRQHLLGRTGPPSSSRSALATAPVAGHHQLRGRQRDAPSCGTPEVTGPTQGRVARSPGPPAGSLVGGGGPAAALPATLWSWSRSLLGGACPVRTPRGLCPRIRTLEAWRRTPSS